MSVHNYFWALALLLCIPAWQLTRDRRTDQQWAIGLMLAILALSVATLGWLIDLGYF